MKAVLLLLLLVISDPLGAQFDLTPGQGGNKEHVSWKIALEPAKLAPGERGEIVASYETTKGWYLYAPDHGASTGLPTSIGISFTGSGEVIYKDDKDRLWKMGQLISD